MPALVVGIVLDRGGEQRVDEGRLAQPRLASNLNENNPVRIRSDTAANANSNHDGEGSAPLRDNLVSLVGQIGNANR